MAQNIAHFNLQPSLSDVDPSKKVKDASRISNCKRSAAVEFVSSQWQNVTSRAHFIMNEDGIPVLIEARAFHPAALNVEDHQTAAAPIQTIESSCISQCVGQSSASVAQNIEITINNLDDLRLSPSEQSSFMKAAAHTSKPSFDVANKEMDSSRFPNIDLPSSSSSLRIISTSSTIVNSMDYPSLSISEQENKVVPLMDNNLDEKLPRYMAGTKSSIAKSQNKTPISNDRLGCIKPSIPSNAKKNIGPKEPPNSGTEARYKATTISSSIKCREKATVNKEKNGHKKWSASTKPENPDGPIKPLPPMDNYRNKMDAPRKKHVKTLKTIKANKNKAIERINDTYSQLRLPATEQFEQTEDFGWICKDSNVYSSLPPMGNEEEYKEQYFETNIKLGEGASGLVCVGWRKSDDKEVAIKKIKKSQEKIRFAGNVNGKIYPIEYCHLRMLSGTSGISNILDAFEIGDEYVLILETMDMCMSLDSFLMHRPRIPERHCKFIFRQLIEAVGQCHNLGIFHRDIKLSNILIEINTCEVKLIDFDASALARYSPFTDNPGTIGYMSPEMDDESVKYEGSPAEVYSMGVVLYDLIFHAIRWKLLIKHLPKPDVSTNCLDLISKMTATRPEDRISFGKILDHPWIKSD